MRENSVNSLADRRNELAAEVTRCLAQPAEMDRESGRIPPCPFCAVENSEHREWRLSSMVYENL
jgi:hypothetical protein